METAIEGPANLGPLTSPRDSKASTAVQKQTKTILVLPRLVGALITYRKEVETGAQNTAAGGTKTSPSQRETAHQVPHLARKKSASSINLSEPRSVIKPFAKWGQRKNYQPPTRTQHKQKHCIAEERGRRWPRPDARCFLTD